MDAKPVAELARVWEPTWEVSKVWRLQLHKTPKALAASATEYPT